MARIRLVLPLLVALAWLASGAAAQTLYRYTDANGRVVYSDQPPPPSAKDAQAKQLRDNVIETDPVPLQARQAAEHFPVTLYTFDCDICREAQALLVKRGIPFQTVIVSEEAGAAKLKALTGKQSAPVLTIGDKEIMQGYNEQRWQAMLDEAGYPRSMPTLPRAPASGAAAGGAPTGGAATTAAPKPAAEASKPAAEASGTSDDTAPAGPGTGYPK